MDETLRTPLQNAFAQHYLGMKQRLAMVWSEALEKAVLLEWRFLEVEVLQAIEDYQNDERGE